MSSENSQHKKKVGQGYTEKERMEVKSAYLNALRKNGGLKTAACAAAGGVTWDTIVAWKGKDPEFAAAEKEAIERGSECFGDMVEGKLMQRISEGDTTAIIFALKTRFRGRGYTEHTEVNASVQAQPIVIETTPKGAEALKKIMENAKRKQ